MACVALGTLAGLFFWVGGPANLVPAAAQSTTSAWSYASFYESQAGSNFDAAQNIARPTTTPQDTARPVPTGKPKTQASQPVAQPAAATTPPAAASDWEKAQLITNEYARMLASNEIAGPDKVEKQPTKAATDIKTNLVVRAGQYNPIGAPTISLATFAHFLQANNSPAYPEAATMYENCLKLNCDPAVALAFFNHESSMGTAGAAVGHKSFGNIRCTPGWPCDYSDGGGGFKIYASWTESLIDWVNLLQVYADKFKLYTLDQIIPVYAPAADNNSPVTYINTVKNLVDQYRAYRP